MALFWGLLIVSFVGCSANGEFSILYLPNSIKFSGTSKILQSTLKEIFAFCLGLSEDENSEWEGLSMIDPFSTPEAIVDINIDGVSSLGNFSYLKSKFSLIVDEHESDTFEAVSRRIKQKFPTAANKLVNINLSDRKEFAKRSVVSVFGVIDVPKVSKQKISHLRYSVEEDYRFLDELETLKAISKKIESGVVNPDNKIDFYNFRYHGLRALTDFHGSKAVVTEEATKLLQDGLRELIQAFAKTYDGSVLVTAITNVGYSRRIRALSSTPATANTRGNFSRSNDGDATIPPTTEAPTTSDNTDFDSDFAAIFNIIIGFVVLYCFSLIATVHTIMDIDPGRDSIIYRMTSARVKKDI